MTRQIKHKMQVHLSPLVLAVVLLLSGCSIHQDDGASSANETGNTTELIENTEGTGGDVMILPEDLINYTATDIRNLETSSGKQAAVTIDIVCQLCRVNYGLNDIRNTILNIRNIGIRRVYLIMCSPSYPVMSGDMITAAKEGTTAHHITESLKKLGDDPNKIFIEMCHEYGLEAIAVIKPYEGGGGCTIPEGTSLERVLSEYSAPGTPETIGGYRIFMDSFISEHPELRVKRKENTGENASGPITSMVLYYQIGTDKTDLVAANNNPNNAPTIWYSSTNAQYKIWENITWRYDKVSKYPICDANGNILSYKDCVRLTIEIRGLSDAYRYVACSLSDSNFLMNADYWSRPYAMAKIYSGNNELPSTLGYFVRSPYDKSATPDTMIWGAYDPVVSASELKGVKIGKDGSVTGVYKSGGPSTGAEEFYKWGFEFEFVYTSAITSGLLSPVVALGVGKNEYVQGMLCEGYREVRDYWMQQVKQALNYGANGIDIRWDSHSCMVSDYFYYGYNEPIAEAYQKKYGVRLNDEPVNEKTAARIMTIRGDFFVDFLENASKAAHEQGAIFISHFFATTYTDDIGSDSYHLSEGGNMVAQWKMPKILVRDYRRVIDLCDEIVYKDYYTPYFVQSDWSLGQILTDYAHQKQKKIWVHCYVQQNSGQLTEHYMDSFLKSPADGVILYEITPSYPYAATESLLSKYLKINASYQISILGRISSISKGTTARELINNLHFLGSNVVVDETGKSVSPDTVLTADMKLCLNNRYYYNFSIR